jgi:hypothetical protein
MPILEAYHPDISIGDGVIAEYFLNYALLQIPDYPEGRTNGIR